VILGSYIGLVATLYSIRWFFVLKSIALAFTHPTTKPNGSRSYFEDNNNNRYYKYQKVFSKSAEFCKRKLCTCKVGRLQKQVYNTSPSEAGVRIEKAMPIYLLNHF